MSSSVNGAASSPRLSTRERRFLRVQRPIASCRFRSLRRQREGWGCESTILRVQRPPASCRCRSLRLQREGWGCESTILRVQRRLPRADADFCACSARAGVTSQRFCVCSVACLVQTQISVRAARGLGLRVNDCSVCSVRQLMRTHLECVSRERRVGAVLAPDSVSASEIRVRAWVRA